MSASQDSVNNTIGSERAQRLVSEIIRRLVPDDSFDARSILREHPELNRHHSVVIDLAYEEYCRRIEAGEQIDAHKFATRFGDHRSSLLQVLKVHEYIEGDPRFQTRTFDKWPRSGDHFLGVTLVEEIGRGAFSRVFVAMQPQLGDRHVVVKVCINGSEEAHVLGRLEHRHIVPVYSVENDHESGLTAICMPLLSRATLHDVVQSAFAGGQIPRQGRTMLEIIRRVNQDEQRIEADRPAASRLTGLGPNSFVDQIVNLGRQLAEALQYTHSQGLYHCDVKPSNVLLTPDGRAMLLDFNLAFGMIPGERNIGGTLPYMAPEQLHFVADPTDQVPDVDPRTDVFSLGVTLYESLSGELPFGTARSDGNRRQAALSMLARQREGPRPLEECNPHVDSRLGRLIGQAIAVDRADRPASAEVFAEQLRRAITPGARSRRWARSRRTFLTLSGGAAVGLVSLSVIGWWNREPFHEIEMRLGDEAMQSKAYKEAESHYTNVLVIEPENTKALFRRGRARMLRGQYEEAEVDLQLLDGILAGHDGFVRVCLGHCISSNVTIGPNAPEATPKSTDQRRIAVARKSLALKRAIEFYTSAIDLGVESPVIHNNLGYCYVSRSLWFKAYDSYVAAVSSEEGPIAAYLWLARIDRRLAIRERRIPDVSIVEKALELQSASIEIQLDAACVFAYAAFCKDEGKMDDSVDYVRLALSAAANAVQFGLPSDQLRTVVSFYPEIADLPEFTQIRSMDSGIPSNKIEPLIDPINGLRLPDHL